MSRLARLAAIILGCALALPPVRADLGTDAAQLAATGRFDELERLLESEAARGPLATPDQHALCFAYSRIKRYGKLMPCLDRLSEAIRKGPRHTRLFGLDDATPTVHLMRATAQVELGQHKEAVAEAAKVLAWMEAERSLDKDMEIEALALMSIGSTLSGDRAAGEQHAQRLAKVSVAWPAASDYAGIKAMALARSWSALGRYDKALAAIRADTSFEFKVFLDNLVSGAAFRGVSNWTWAELPRGFLVNRALLETGQTAEAKAGFDRLLATDAVRANGEIYWLILYDRGRIADAEGRHDEAVEFYRRAIDAIEEQRASINTETAKIGFVGDKQVVYARAVGALLQLGRSEAAFEIIERAKARALVDLLAAKDDFAAPRGEEKAVAATLTMLREAGSAAAAQLPLAASRAGESRAAPSLKKARAELSSISPELASLIAVTSISAREVQSRLEPDEAVLEYYAHGQDLYAAAVSRNKVTVRKLDAGDLEPLVRRFRKELEARGDRVQDEARALYDRLVRPLQAELAAKNLLVIPHGLLHYVSFAALHDGNDYWVERHNLRFLPSASVVKFLKPPRGRSLDSMLVLGNPDVGDARLDLPAAEKEARAISAMGAKSELLTRRSASETSFKRLAPGFRTLHVASHGEYNAQDALRSRLLLAPDGENDGSLTTSELYGMRLDAELVTLSACETGLGAVLSGDDVVGLTRGFLYAGAANVVATLWEVDDEATTFLMQRFYASIKSGMSKRDALRAAQMETRKKRPHPFFWAAFFITGQGI